MTDAAPTGAPGAAPAPCEPPLTHPDLPAAGGTIGPAVEDFRVDELPLYAASGSGEHWHVRIEKRGLTTQEAIRAVARAAGVPPGSIGSAGMKDRHAVTTQWLSVSVVGAAEPATWSLPDGVTLLEVARHENKLRTGHLRGNRFRIHLVGVAGDALNRAHSILERVCAQGMMNTFGPQRFGYGGRNLTLALAAARGGRRQRGSKFQQKLLPSVLQAEVFNRYAVRRQGDGLDAVIAGEVLRLSGSKSMFVADDPARETDRFRVRDVVPTGPIVGPKMRSAALRALELESEAMSELGLTAESFRAFGRFAQGARRDLLVWPEETEAEQRSENTLTVGFVLPPGSYATALIRELTHASYWDSVARGDENGEWGGPRRNE
jgi:tRNA pseudouridine13 synthase